MKKRLLVCAVLLLCAGLLLSGCAGVAETPEEAVLTPTQSPAPTQEPVSPAPSMPSPAENAKSPLARIEEQKEAMKAFLLEHQTEMEELVALLTEYSGGDDGQYLVSLKILELFDSGSSLLKETLTEHPIITKAGFLDERLFLVVFTDFHRRIVGNDICCFTQFLDDDEGTPYCEVFLFYCEDEPVEHPFFAIEPVDPMLPHWYFYVEWLE